MLRMTFGTCEICKTAYLPFTIQEAHVKCLKCGKEYQACEKCKKKGCPECSGELESSMDTAAKYGILY